MEVSKYIVVNIALCNNTQLPFKICALDNNKMKFHTLTSCADFPVLSTKVEKIALPI